MNMQSWIALGIVIVGLLGFFLVPMMVFQVDEREQAVLLFFGNPVAEHKAPGMYFKSPLHEVRRMAKTAQFWAGEGLSDLPTKDDKKIEVRPWATWRITEPKLFVQRLRNEQNAQERVMAYVRSAVRDVVVKYELQELVRTTNRPLSDPLVGVTSVVDGVDTSHQDHEDVILPIRTGREKILHEMLEAARREMHKEGTAGGRGIELVDVGLSHVEFVPTVQQAAFERQVARMRSEAEKYKAHGERTKQEILNKTKAEAAKIESQGDQLSRELRGNIEAEITRAYADALNETGEFYIFVRTLAAYKKAFNSDTRLILTSNNEFLRLLKSNSAPLNTPPRLELPAPERAPTTTAPPVTATKDP